MATMRAVFAAIGPSRRAANVAAMQNLMQASADAGQTLDAAQTEQYDTLSVEVKSLDGQLARWRELDALLGQPVRVLDGRDRAGNEAGVVAPAERRPRAARLVERVLQVGRRVELLVVVDAEVPRRLFQ